MKVKKQCVTCKTVYEADTYDGLSEYFYKMKDWLKNTCRKCECEEHRQKYADGTYNYKDKNTKKYGDNKFGFGCF